MSARNTFGAVFVVVLVGGAVALVMHERKEVSRAASVGEPLAGEQPTETAAPSGQPPALNSPAASAHPSDSKKPAAPMEASSPIRAGEIWDFSANVSKLSAVANLKLKVAEKRNFQGKSAWHLQAFAHTQNPLRMVFELDDQFDSYSDAGTMASLQYELHLSERGQKVDSIQRMTTTSREAASGNASQTRVLPGTRDPLGMMQFLRHVDWSKMHEVRGPIHVSQKLHHPQ